MRLALFLSLFLGAQAWAQWSVTTYNIRNFDDDFQAGRTNLPELKKIILESQSDVMAFEEVVNVKAFKALMKDLMPSYEIHLSTCGGTGRQNLALVHNPKVFKFSSQEEDMRFSSGGKNCGSLRPALLVTLTHIKEKNDYTFGILHLKAGGNSRAFAQRWKQYQLLSALSASYQNKNLILLGDFNTTGYNIKNEDYLKFDEFIQSSSSFTVAEKIACTNYWDGGKLTPEYVPSILDHIVVQSKLAPSITSIEVGSHCNVMDCNPALPQDLGLSFNSVSDHCPVKVIFE